MYTISSYISPEVPARLQGDHHALKVHLFQIVHQGGGVFLVKPHGYLRLRG